MARIIYEGLGTKRIPAFVIPTLRDEPEPLLGILLQFRVNCTATVSVVPLQ